MMRTLFRMPPMMPVSGDTSFATIMSPETGIMGGTRNSVRIISRDGAQEWPDLPKDEVAARLADLVAKSLT